MDLRMPRCDGVRATGLIRQQHPETRVVVLTTYADDEHILAALRAGALGYLTKDAGRRQIEQAVRAAAAGQAVLEASVLGLIAAGLSNREIARRLYVTEVTVKSHINRLFAKTGVRDRAQAVRYASDHGLARPDR